jgi:methyl-accepting chemotaxis protein
MNAFLLRLTVAQRLLLTLGALVAALLVGGAIGLKQMSQANASYRELVSQRSPGYVALARSQRHFQIVARHLNHMVIEAATPATVEALWGKVREEFANFETRTAQYEKGNPDEKAQADRNRTMHREIEQGAAKVYELAKAGNGAEANKAMRGVVDPAVDRLRDTLKDHVDEVLAEQARFTEIRSAQFASAMWLLLLSVLGGVAAATAVGLPVVRSIVRPLGEAKAMAREIAEGKLVAAAGPADHGAASHASRDEVGQLLATLHEMRARLADTITRLQAAATSIRGASDEVAAGSLSLGQRTESAASNLQQTASSMQQLTNTVQHTAQSARTANQLASSASSVAQRGGEVVSQVVSTMDEISASSRRIADIIGTIDGIAFQTNILALNAAVEAARAGEQGRGFAVVASEVRSLAQRSAEAAREIKSLISSSVEKVESGSRLVADAGSTMGELVASVQRVTDIIGEISAGAAEQSEGIGSMNRSIGELDASTQQNAALVEESTAAAESLKTQSRQLGELVARFDVGAGTTAGAGAQMAPGASGSHAAPKASHSSGGPAAGHTPAALASRTIGQARRAPAATAQATSPAVPAPADARPARSGPAKPANTPAPAPAPAAAATAQGGDEGWETF